MGRGKHVSREYKRSEKRSDPVTRRIVLLILSIGVLCFSLYKLIITLRDNRAAEETYAEITQKYITAEEYSANDGIDIVETLTEDVVTDNPDEYGDGTDAAAYNAHCPIAVRFDEMVKAYPDTAGWIYGEDTPVSYPIVQGANNEYYLYRLINGVSNINGSIYIDCNGTKDFSGQNTVMYGHNMNDGSMLASLCNYKKQDYYDSHPVMYLLTPEKNYCIELFSAYTTTGDDALAYAYAFPTDESMQAFIDYAFEKSDFKCDVAVTPDDRVVTFSTCSYTFANARYIVHGKLIPIG